MRSVVMHAPRGVGVEDVADPTIQMPTDRTPCRPR